jgi:hypothetical protein
LSFILLFYAFCHHWNDRCMHAFFCWDGVSQFSPTPGTVILPISASEVNRIIGVGPLCPTQCGACNHNVLCWQKAASLLLFIPSVVVEDCMHRCATTFPLVFFKICISRTVSENTK